MTEDATTCVAQERGCGTLTGWRNGGRCVKCRRAHNGESRASRAMTPEQRARVLDLLRIGKSPQEAAEDVGRTERSLQAAAVRDGELRAALDGEPLRQQVINRKGDLLLAMIRNGGNRAQAAREIGENPLTVHSWKRHDPLFGAAEEAVSAWIAKSDIGRRFKVSMAQLDQAAALMESGMAPAQAAEAVGTTDASLRKYRDRHKRLDAAWEALTRSGLGTKQSGLTPEVADHLRRLWPDWTMTVGEIAAELGVTGATVGSWRKQLGLPPRSQATGRARATGETRP